jgi:hypothetical protein
MLSKEILLKLIISFFILISVSCRPIFQVMEISSSDTKVVKNEFLYENEELKISYDFWSSSGYVFFTIINKLDQPIYIDWNRSHFIYKGQSLEYWNDSEETTSFYSEASYSYAESFKDQLMTVISGKATLSSSKSSIGRGTKSAVSTTYRSKQKKILQIPPKAFIHVVKYSIADKAYFNCDFNLKFKKNKEPNEIKFIKELSPLTFRNI